MAVTSRNLYESPKEQSLVELLYDGLTLLASGFHIVSGIGLALQVSIIYSGVTTSRTYAPEADVIWLFAVPPAVTLLSGNLSLPGFTSWSVQHAVLAPSLAALPIL